MTHKTADAAKLLGVSHSRMIAFKSRLEVFPSGGKDNYGGFLWTDSDLDKCRTILKSRGDRRPFQRWDGAKVSDPMVSDDVCEFPHED